MTIGKIRREKHITSEMVKNDLRSLYLFGDNMQRRGRGGQAAEMRGYSNALGVPTKYAPSMAESAFFTNEAILKREVYAAIVNPFLRAQVILLAGHDVVIPADGIGTGLAQLPTRAPVVYELIQKRIAFLEELANQNG